jgi:phosphate transport system substrate-binding protein
LALAALMLVCLASGCGVAGNPAVILMGSSSVQPYVEILAEEYTHAHPDREIDVLAGGSSAGIMAVRSEIADIGMSSRTLKENELDLQSAEIAKDGLALIIHPNNPVRGLTLEQVRDIYAGTLTYWGDVGGSDARIHVITREEGSGSRDAFEMLVMDSLAIRPRAIVQDSNGAVKQLISSDVNSVGFISSGLVDEKVRAVSLEGVAATRENIANGSYALYRPFLFVWVGQLEEHAKQFVDYILAAEGQKVLETEGLVTAGGR